jgi:hypothetical protein
MSASTGSRRLAGLAHQPTQFPVPDRVGAYQITNAIDGNLWFTGYITEKNTGAFRP